MTDTRLVVVASGPQGPPGTLRLLTLEPWDIASFYRKNDIVAWNSVLYVAKENTLGEQPDTHPQVWGPLDIETHEGAQAKTTAAQAFAVQRANHTGTQLAATISDFDGQVRSSRLDQLATPTTEVQFGGHRAVSLGDPTSAQDAATKHYVDAVAAALVPNSTLGQPGGPALLDSGGKVLATELPALTINEYLGAVSSQAAMLALVGQRGDWCQRTDFDPVRQYTLGLGDDPTQLANWVQTGSGSQVNTVAGKTGDVTLAEADIANLPTDLAAKAPALTVTAVKAVDYTLAANEFVPFNALVASRTGTLPTAPPDGTRAAAKMVFQDAAAANHVTMACGGSDVFNKAGGATTLTLSVLNQAVSLQYKAGIWYVVGDDLPLGSLDGRYLQVREAGLPLDKFTSYVTNLGAGNEDWGPAITRWGQELAGAVGAGPAVGVVPPKVNGVGVPIPYAIRTPIITQQVLSNATTTSLVIQGSGMAGHFLVALTDNTQKAWRINGFDFCHISDFMMRGTKGVGQDAFCSLSLETMHRLQLDSVEFYGLGSESDGGSVLAMDSLPVYANGLAFRACRVQFTNPANDPSICRISNWMTVTLTGFKHLDFALFLGDDIRVGNKSPNGSGPATSALAILDPRNSGQGIENGSTYDGTQVTLIDPTIDEGQITAIVVKSPSAVAGDLTRRIPLVRILGFSIDGQSGGNGSAFKGMDIADVDELEIGGGTFGLTNNYSITGIKLRRINRAKLKGVKTLAPNPAAPYLGGTQVLGFSQIDADTSNGLVQVENSPTMDLSTVTCRLETDAAPRTFPAVASAVAAWGTSSKDGDNRFNTALMKTEFYLGGISVDADGNVLTPPAVVDYDPANITGLASGAAVATWADASGNGRDAVQATGGQQPLWVSGVVNNGKTFSVVRFDGVDDFLRSALWTPSRIQPYTLLVVRKRLNTTATMDVVDALTPNVARLESQGSSSFGNIRFNGGAQLSPGYTSGTHYADTLWHLVTVVANGANSVIRVDGTQIAAGDAGTNALNALTVGGSSATSPGNFFGGDVAAVKIWPAALSGPALLALEAALGIAKGITIAGVTEPVIVLDGGVR